MIPAPLSNRISAVWGEEGQEWLARFPEILAEITADWNLKDLRPFENLSYNFVAAATRDGEPVALKLGVPREEMATEALALQVFDGRKAARLLRTDHEKGAILIERLKPGASMWSEWSPKTDDAQTEMAARTMIEMLRPPSLGFPTTKDWFEALTRYQSKYGTTGPLPHDLIAKAISATRELHASNTDQRLLHGDFHHDNILLSGDEWKVIDPKGIIGPREFEIGAWIRNPCDRILKEDPEYHLLDRRLNIFAEITNLDLQCIRAWIFCGCMLSACWSIEDEGEGGEDAIAFARALEKFV